MKKIEYSYTRERLFSGYDGKTCKVDPSIAYDGKDTAFLHYRMLLLSGSDVFYDSYAAKSTDGGKTFAAPQKMTRLETFSDGIRKLWYGGLIYNKFHKKWFGLGRIVSYENDEHAVLVNEIQVCTLSMVNFNPETGDWSSEATEFEFPYEYLSATPMLQLVEYDNGDMLIPFYFNPKGNIKSSVVTVRYRFDGDTLKVVEAGEPISGENYERGFMEPSVTCLNDEYFLTIRSNEIGLMACSKDGYHFTKPEPWRWDDGSTLENYNTMQHWVRNKDGLFLAYTRKGAHNDHVFRHRAPIFMTRFDEDKKCLIRDEEIILVPELGARLGNYWVIEASEDESWLTTAEWMQPAGCEKYGCDNSLWLARVFWKND